MLREPAPDTRHGDRLAHKVGAGRFTPAHGEEDFGEELTCAASGIRRSVARSLNDVHRSAERRFYSHFTRIEQVRILGRPHRRIDPRRVALVAAMKIGQHLVVIGACLRCAATGSDRRCCRDKKFGRRVRTYDGADIATIENGAAPPLGESALLTHQCLSKPRHDGDSGCRLGNDRPGKCVKVEHIEVDGPGDGDSFGLIVEGMTVFQEGRRNGTIGQSGIEVVEVEMGRKPPREGAFAGRGRTVDRDNHVSQPLQIRTKPRARP